MKFALCRHKHSSSLWDGGVSHCTICKTGGKSKGLTVKVSYYWKDKPLCEFYPFYLMEAWQTESIPVFLPSTSLPELRVCCTEECSWVTFSPTYPHGWLFQSRFSFSLCDSSWFFIFDQLLSSLCYTLPTPLVPSLHLSSSLPSQRANSVATLFTQFKMILSPPPQLAMKHKC